MGIFNKIMGNQNNQGPETVPVRNLVNPQAPPMGPPGYSPSTMQNMAQQNVQPMARPMPPQFEPQGRQFQPQGPPSFDSQTQQPSGAIRPMNLPPAPVLPMSQMQQSFRSPVRDEENFEKRDVFGNDVDQAPVFIKIDRYEDVLSELSAVKATIENVRTLMEIFAIMKDVNADAVGVLDSLAKEMERSQIKLDKILGRMEPVEERVKGSKYDRVTRSAPKELTEIEDRISKLRSEIKRLGKV